MNSSYKRRTRSTTKVLSLQPHHEDLGRFSFRLRTHVSRRGSKNRRGPRYTAGATRDLGGEAPTPPPRTPRGRKRGSEQHSASPTLEEKCAIVNRFRRGRSLSTRTKHSCCEDGHRPLNLARGGGGFGLSRVIFYGFTRPSLRCLEPSSLRELGREEHPRAITKSTEFSDRWVSQKKKKVNPES